MTVCPVVTLNDLVMDGTTEDSDGIVYLVTKLDGWWDSALVRSSTQEVLPVGEVLTANREQARALVLEVVASTVTPNTTALGDDCFTAIYNVKFACRLVNVPGLITVVDPVITTHALVRRVGSGVKAAIQGDAHSVLFQIQLLAEDPTRYGPDDAPHD